MRKGGEERDGDGDGDDDDKRRMRRATPTRGKGRGRGRACNDDAPGTVGRQRAQKRERPDGRAHTKGSRQLELRPDSNRQAAHHSHNHNAHNRAQRDPRPYGSLIHHILERSTETGLMAGKGARPVMQRRTSGVE